MIVSSPGRSFERLLGNPVGGLETSALPQVHGTVGTPIATITALVHSCKMETSCRCQPLTAINTLDRWRRKAVPPRLKHLRG